MYCVCKCTIINGRLTNFTLLNNISAESNCKAKICGLIFLGVKIMKKFRLLCLALAIALALSMLLVACNGDTVQEHDHIWDNGAVTVEPNCHSEGLRTFSCTVEGCTQTKSEPIAMKQHNWDEGVVTVEPTCRTNGTKTYTCQNEGCNATKPETLGKSNHNWDEGVLMAVPDFYTPGQKKYTCLTDGCGETRTESVGARADFAEQYYFSLAGANSVNPFIISPFNLRVGHRSHARRRNT